ncbi:DNL zinc finger-domain-containing protein [Schizophyllum amplum]|uniref:DNL zinc finger-domain-containing protein n=1 Tax=Schizophyllum amplum TaxID=97359 RepID=A0A550CKX4_9AGAR|nr:DNL zinc finger-domain-containing protein [Auriculariopsis ampla]
MLPSRLFRNVGIPPALRSLITPGASLPPTARVEMRFRLGLSANSIAAIRTSAASKDAASPAPPASAPTTTRQQLPTSDQEPRLQITFTCTASDCTKHRSTHTFTKRAYTSGIVLVQCPQCKNRHLIADHLGWFKESTEDGKMRTVEDLLKAKGETVQRGSVTPDGDIEYLG